MTAVLSSAGRVVPSKEAGAETMRRNGRSFWFASLFLPREVSSAAAQLYAFCRVMDDLADKSGTPEAVQHLERVRHDLRHGSSGDPHVAGLLELAGRYPLPLEAADHLIASFVADAARRMAVANEAELIRYCFGVAGTVGLLMAPVLGVSSPDARCFAADLGIAMQITNIARDVAEDARNGRRYLPGDWIGGMTPADIASAKNGPDNVEVAAGIVRLLALADRFYARAQSGFPMIPANSRRAIQVAASVYREIGVRLKKRCMHGSGLSWKQERIVVPRASKVRLACAVYAGASPLALLPLGELSVESLNALRGLPGLP